MTLTWPEVAIPLVAVLFLIGLRIQDWIAADVVLKQEELRGLKAHHRQRFALDYEQQSKKP